jgi:hypothetical protein
LFFIRVLPQDRLTTSWLSLAKPGSSDPRVGSFFLANLSTSSTAYELNGGRLPPGPRTSPGPTPPLYTPYFITTEIERNWRPGALGSGVNRLKVTFNDAPEPPPPYEFAIELPESFSILDDFVSFVSRAGLIFLDKRGNPVPPNPLFIPPEPIPSAGPPS